jgi:elongation factor P
MISTNQFKNGNHIDVEGTVFKILEFQHVKPGKGGAFVRTKLRRAADGAVIDRTFRAGEKFRPVRTEARKMQFLYADGTDAHFMDSESFEQIAIPEDSVEETLQWIRPNETVDLLYIDDQPATSSSRPPSSSRSRTPSRACAATPRRAAARSRPRWRRAPRSACRCS